MNHSAPNDRRHHDVVIVGGGVIGLAMAWELVRRGKQVCVLDETSSHWKTSWTAAGILPPANPAHASEPIELLRGHSHQLWPKWAADIGLSSGIDVGLRRCGGWYLAESVGEAAAMTGMRAYWEELEIACEPVSCERLIAEQPDLADWIERNPWIANHPEHAAWWTPDEYQIRPSWLLKSLTEACVKQGVRFIDGAKAHSVNERENCVSLATQESEYTADQAVLCGGAATGLIDLDLRLHESLIPVRGQMLLLHSEALSAPAILNLGSRYLIARGDGHILVGSCEEEVGFVSETTVEVIDSLRDFACHMCPALQHARVVDSWAGLRPMTFDGFPMIGRLPNHTRVFVSAGHYRSGIHLAPGSAVLLADVMEGESSIMPIEPFSVSRQPA